MDMSLLSMFVVARTGIYTSVTLHSRPESYTMKLYSQPCK